MDEYDVQWPELKRRRNLALFAFFRYAPITFAFVLLTHKLFQSYIPAFVFAIGLDALLCGRWNPLQRFSLSAVREMVSSPPGGTTTALPADAFIANSPSTAQKSKPLGNPKCDMPDLRGINWKSGYQY
jgi:hypothetical protein